MDRTRSLAVALLGAALLAGVAAVLAGAVAAPSLGSPAPEADPTFVVSDDRTGERYLTAPVPTGARIGLEYTHSVERSRVYEAYAVREDHLELVRIEFESYGWGLPTGADVRTENGTFVAERSRPVAELTVSPGRIADHRLHVNGQRHDLVALSDGRAVDLRIVPPER